MRSFLLYLCLLGAITSFSQVNLNQGLVAHYPLNGNANDISTNANNGIPFGVTSTTDRFGNPSSALYFDGIDDYIRIPNSPSFNATSAVSITFYFKPARNGTQTLIGKTNFQTGAATQFQVAMDFSPVPGLLYGVNPAGNGCVSQSLNASYVNTGGGPLPLNKWYCAVASFENGIQKIYVDGVLVQTVTAAFTSLNVCPEAEVNIGRWWSGDLQRFNGSIDDIRIYNRAITADEAGALCEVPTAACSDWLYTPSQNAYMSVGDLDISGNKLTIEALINRTQPYSPGVGDDNDGDIVSKHLGPPNTNYLLRPNHGYITTTNGFFATPDICDIELNKTYHLAMVYDGASLKFYRNGELMGQTAASGNLFQNDYPTRIGRYTGVTVENFLGYIDEVRIWNTARTQTEIQANMQVSLASPATQTGLQAYYTFDNLLNKQGNAAWNGVLTGAAQINTTNPSCDLATTTCRQPDQPGMATFTAADTICVNNSLTITNTSTGQATNYWNFCAANINTPPIGTNMGNIGGMLTSPVYLDYVKDNNNYYGFVTDNHTGNLLRLEFGNSLLNNPSIFNLGNFAGLIPVGVEGLQIIRNENKWYVIIVAGDFSTGGPARLIKIELGSTITNPSPAATNWGNIGSMSYPHDLYIFQDGARWYGFTANTNNNTITRFDFTNSFSNTPIGTNLGNVGTLNGPTGLYTINDNGNWYTFVTNNASSTLTRLDFGNSLLNTPTGVNLGNPGGVFHQCWDISLIKYCDGLYGYIINANQAYNNLLKLDFGSSITNTPSITNFGNTGNMLFPHSISRLFRTNDDLYAFVTNVDNNTITRLRFAGCSNASIPSSTATNPPPITYNAPGTYNINLTVDDGLPTQASFCKPVVVLPPPPHTATPTFTICAGSPPIKIGRDITGTTTYQWSTGATTDSIDISQPGTYWVDMTRFGCTTRDSFLLREETADFSFTQDLCNPLQVTFYNGYSNPVSSNWDLGNGTSTQNNPTTTYPAYGDYTVSLSVQTASGCRVNISKPVTISIKTDSVIINNDTTLCHDATLQLRSIAGVAYCWYPATGLSATNIANPVATPPTSPMTYYVNAQVVGQNIVTNGDFSQGNTGFTSAYVYSPNNTTEGQYMVSPFPRNWNPNVQACNDHTTGSGNMMMVNGSPVADVNVWKQTITVTPNTDYAFSTWIQAIHSQNPARLQFSINDQQLGALISADPVPCTWKQFYTIWNSGTATTATISIINKNTIIAGNDFALDDISFAPVTLQKDSIIISRERPVVTVSGNNEICEKKSTTLTAAGAATYTWSPATGLDNAGSPAPIASPVTTTTYTVTGTTLKGCTDDDAITITVHPAPGITITEDTAICKNSSVQLHASGGITYSWTPVATLDDASSPRPVASPGSVPVKYYVTVTDARTCTNTDSVMINMRPDPVFTISGDKTICDRDTIRITAGGGDVYSWQPAATLSDSELAAPFAFPSLLTTYSVHITDTVCDNSADLSTTIRVNPLPNVTGTSTNDLDCSYGSTQLNATGARRYLWSPAAGLNNPAIANPVASPITAIDYVVKGTDILGCSNTDTVKVALLTTNKGDNLVPNAFTPNGDGKNDCFGIRYWGVIEKIDFSVYNRWGERVFYTNMPNGCWDGVYKGKKQDGNVFVYFIRAVTNCGIIERKGTVVLIQ